jgi:hypothetical protein
VLFLSVTYLLTLSVVAASSAAWQARSNPKCQYLLAFCARPTGWIRCILSIRHQTPCPHHPSCALPVPLCPLLPYSHDTPHLLLHHGPALLSRLRLVRFGWPLREELAGFDFGTRGVGLCMQQGKLRLLVFVSLLSEKLPFSHQLQAGLFSDGLTGGGTDG